MNFPIEGALSLLLDYDVMSGGETFQGSMSIFVLWTNIKIHQVLVF